MLAFVLAASLLADVDAKAAEDAEHRAFTAIDEKRWCDAASLFQDAFDAEPNVVYLLNAARAATSADDFELALTLTSRAATLAPARGNEIRPLISKLVGKASRNRCPARAIVTPPATLPATRPTETTTAPSKTAPATTAPATTAPATTAPATTTTAPAPPAPATTAPATTAPATTAPGTEPATTSATTASTTAASTMGPGGVWWAGVVTAGVGAAVVVVTAGYAGALELELRNTGGGVTQEQKAGDLEQAVPVGAALCVGLAAAVVGAILVGAGG